MLRLIFTTGMFDMSKLNVYSVYDVKVEAFMPPFMARNHAEAQRMFIASLSDRNPNKFVVPPADLDLYYIAQWDDTVGEYGVPETERLTVPLRVLSGREAEAKGLGLPAVPQAEMPV